MPQNYQGFGYSIMYPDTWSVEEDTAGEMLMIESPEGAFMTVSKFKDVIDLDSTIEQARLAMDAEYDEVEIESLVKQIADRELAGITQRFVYLDLIITSHLLSFHAEGNTYLVQVQAEDRDMVKLELVFDAMLTSMCQSLWIAS